MKINTQHRSTLENKLIEKAVKDPSFRQALLQDPTRAIEHEMGVRLPDSLKIHVVEEDARTFYLILPPPGQTDHSTELSESDLQQVAGGTNFFDTQCSTWSWIMTQCDAC